MLETIAMSEIKAATSSYFFSDGAMNFFKTRLPSTGLRNGANVFFWTSERGPDGIRKFSVRVLCLSTGKVTTVGEFQQYRSAKSASAAVYRAATNN
jgi:hypothetical protein